MWTDDPVKDFERHDAEQQKWLKKRPKCAWCDEHIQEESAIYFEGENEWMCDSCADSMRRYIDED